MTYDLLTDDAALLEHHADGCPASYRRPCSCGPLGYRGAVDDALGPVVPTRREARTWHDEHRVASAAWRSATGGATIDDLIDAFLVEASDGRARDEHGRPFGVAAVRQLQWSLTGYVGTELGGLQVADLRARHARDLVGRLSAQGLAADQIGAVLHALEVLLRYAESRGLVAPSTADALASLHSLPVIDHGMQAGPPTPMNGSGPMPVTGQMPVPGYPPYPGATTGWQPVAPPPAANVGPVPDEVIWLVLKVVAITFTLIALVLVAESV